LIGSIYDCAIDPSRWNHTLAGLRDALDCGMSVIGLGDFRRQRFLFLKAAGFEPWQMERLADHTAEIGGMLDNALESRLSPDEPYVVSRHLSPAYIETSPYFQEWVKPASIVDIMWLFLTRRPMRASIFGAGRNARQGVFTEREVELGRLLAPHLRRAMMISKVMEIRTISGAHAADVLDELRCAVVLANERGAILHANRAALRMLYDGGPIQSVRGVLEATVPAAVAELRSAVALATRDEASIGRTGLAIRLTGIGAPPVFAHVLPLTGSNLRTRLQPAAVAAVFIGAAPDAQDGAEALAAAFSLTPAETKVLASLLAGRTRIETAAALGVSEATAKTHIEHIFLKTGAARRTELMRLWTGLISPAVRTGRESRRADVAMP
jgi:DNA-binding CsgD family transcriptional regulator